MNSLGKPIPDNWLSELNKSNLTWIRQVPPTNPYRCVNKLCQIKGFLPDVVFAIGGGSTIDLAKCCVGLNYLVHGAVFGRGC